MGKTFLDPQTTFDFSVSLPAPAQEAITEAIQRVDDCANKDWKIVFDQCVIDAAHKKSEITSDDVLAEWEAIPNRPSTHNLAAIGPAMKRAAREGVLTSTNRVERSARAVKHGIRHTIWASNIYRPEGNKGVARQEESEMEQADQVAF
jgi:hypothetical protein